MTIKVRYFASLRERLGRGDDEIESSGLSTVGEVWSRVADGAAMPPSMLMAVNLEYVDAGHAVVDGDEVAFFPPVTGG